MIINPFLSLSLNLNQSSIANLTIIFIIILSLFIYQFIRCLPLFIFLLHIFLFALFILFDIDICLYSLITIFNIHVCSDRVATFVTCRNYPFMCLFCLFLFMHWIFVCLCLVINLWFILEYGTILWSSISNIIQYQYKSYINIQT